MKIAFCSELRWKGHMRAEERRCQSPAHTPRPHVPTTLGWLPAPAAAYVDLACACRTGGLCNPTRQQTAPEFDRLGQQRARHGLRAVPKGTAWTINSYDRPGSPTVRMTRTMSSMGTRPDDTFELDGQGMRVDGRVFVGLVRFRELHRSLCAHPSHWRIGGQAQCCSARSCTTEATVAADVAEGRAAVAATAAPASSRIAGSPCAD